MMRHTLEALEGRLLLAARPALELNSAGQEVEPNDTIETATPLAQIGLGIPCREDAVQNGFICPPTVLRGAGRVGGPSSADPDVDYFTFATPSNARVSVQIEGPAVQGGATFELVAPDGTVLAHAEAHDRNGDGVPDGASLEYSAKAEGDLFIRVEFDGTVPAEGLEYHIGASIQVARNVEREPNDTFDTANEIIVTWRPSEPSTLGALLPIRPSTGFGYVRGELGNGDTTPDADFYRFAAGSGVDVDIRVTGAGGQGGHLTVYDAEHNIIKEADPDTDGNLSLSFESESEGAYFVELLDTGTVMCITTPCLTYSLEVREQRPVVNPFAEHEPNDTIETANPIELQPPVANCERYCPVAGIAAANTSAGVNDAFPGTAAFRSIRYDDRLSGYVVGHADLIECPPNADCEFLFVPGSDFFSIETEGDRHLRATLTGPLVRLGGTMTLLGPDGVPLMADADSSDGLTIEWDADVASTFYVSVRVSPDGLAQAGDPNCEPTAAGTCRDATAYRLEVVSGSIANPIEGPSEQEPNDTRDTANVLELREFPTLAPGIELRGGTAHGVAGGATGDQDFYEFDVQAGEHVIVDVQGLVRDGIPRPLELWLREHGLNEYGDAAGTVYPGGVPHLGRNAGAIVDRIEYILANHPEIDVGDFELTVYDADGNEIGTSASGDASAVSFDAAADATYYVSVKSSTTASTEEPGHYRLGVLARSHYDEANVHPGTEPTDGQKPAVIVLGAGKSFTYTDESGDRVELQLRGRSGQATITFSESTPDGSDITSVEIVGVRKGGSFTVDTTGSAEIGSIEIRGSGSLTRRRGGSRSGDFDAVQVDGNVGMVSSAMNLRSLVVDGMLGDLAAPGQQIREVRVALFDSAMADVGSIRRLVVEKDSAESLFEQFLPWDPPPTI